MTNCIFHSNPPAGVELIALGASEEVLAIVTRGYSGVYSSLLEPGDVEKFFADLQLTKLKTPNAFVNMVWLLTNVTRNFEQQLTRYRVGTAFVAESLRFSDKRNAEFYVPAHLTENQAQDFRSACMYSIAKYEDMLYQGAAIQDARGVLPGNICTHMFVSLNLQTLTHIYEQRRCCQAQGYVDGEWGVVLEAMKGELEKQSAFGEMLQAPWDNKNCTTCGFAASFDRPCKEQHRFDKNLKEQAAERLGLFDGVQEVK